MDNTSSIHLSSLHTQITDYISSLHPLHSTHHYLQKLRDYLDIAIETLEAQSVGEARKKAQSHIALEKWTEERWRETVRIEQTRVEAVFKSALENAQWPPKYTINHNQREQQSYAEELSTDQSFIQAWKALMELKPTKPYLPILLMTEPLNRAFKFHFTGQKATNNPAKPEWFFTVIANQIETVKPLFASLRRVLTPKDDLLTEFTLSLLKPLQEKLSLQVPRLEPPLLAHTVHEFLKFSERLTALGELEKIIFTSTNIIKWLKIEEEFSLKLVGQYLSESDAFEMDAEEGIPQASSLIINLVNDMDYRIRQIHDLPLRARYFQNVVCNMLSRALFEIQVQIPKDSVMSALKSRRGEEEELHSITKHLAAICAIHSHLEDMNQDELYISLEETLKGNKDEISSAGAFRVAINAMRKEEDRICDIIEGLIMRQWDHQTKEYTKCRWRSTTMPVEVTPSICAPLAAMSLWLNVFQKHLQFVHALRLIVRILRCLDEWWYSQIIMHNYFSQCGAFQLETDFRSAIKIFETQNVDAFVTKTGSAIRILSLPLIGIDSSMSIMTIRTALGLEDPLEDVEAADKLLARLDVVLEKDDVVEVLERRL